MISLRYFKSDDRVVNCGYDSSVHQFFCLIYTNEDNHKILLDKHFPDILTLFSIFKKAKLQVPASLMIDLIEDKAKERSALRFYKNVLFVCPESQTTGVNAMECIQVWSNDGLYDYIPDATPEYWADILYTCDSYELVEPLTGWGKYNHCYKVELEGTTRFYFVEMPVW